MELLVLAIVFGLGYVVGWVHHAKQLFNRLTKSPDEMIDLLTAYRESAQSLDKTETAHVREISVEKIDNIFYLYDKNTNEFLAQASSLDDALALTKSRYPTHMFQGTIAKEDAKRMGLTS